MLQNKHLKGLLIFVKPEVVKRNISFNETADEFAIESTLAASGQNDKILQMNIVHDPNVPLGMSIIGGSQVNSEVK